MPSADSSHGFDDYFQKATGCKPFPFQRKFADARALPKLIHVILRAADMRASAAAERNTPQNIQRIANDQAEGDNDTHELERSNPQMAKPARERTGAHPPQPDSAPGCLEHDVGGGTGGPTDAGGGTRPPESATRNIETSLGVIS